MLNKHLISRFVTPLMVVLLSSGSLVLALNPTVSSTVSPTPVPRTIAQVLPIQQPAARVQNKQFQNDDQAGWRQAGAEAQHPEVTTQRQSPRLAADGSLHGRISLIGRGGESIPTADLPVKLVSPDGLIFNETTTRANGEFIFQNLQPGVARLIAYGANGIIALGLDLLPSNSGDSPKVVEFQIDAAAIPTPDAALAIQIIKSRVLQHTHGPNASDPASAQIPGGTAEGGNSSDPDAASGSVLTHHQFQLQADGSLNGRVRVLQPTTGRPLKMSAFLLRNGDQIREVSVDPDGTFRFEATEPGVYSFVTAGLDGFAAFAIDVLAANKPVADQANPGEHIPVGLQLAGTTELSVPLSSPSALDALLQNEEPSPETLAALGDGDGNLAGGGSGNFGEGGGGGSGSSGGGGSGVGGGGGGIGPLVGLAGLGGLAAALANNNRRTRPAATPVIP